jgi:hypothetical protein
MIDGYPMGSLAEAERSIRRAVADHMALRISDAEFEAVKRTLARRIAGIKKLALLASAARIGRHDYGAPKEKAALVRGGPKSRSNRHRVI